MSLVPFKKRIIDDNVQVEVYRNLNNGKYSIRQRGLVVAHSDTIHLKNVTFVVRKAGKEKAIETKQRNVHAFVKGYLDYNSKALYDSFMIQVKYNPFKEIGFHDNNGVEVKTATKFFIHNNMCFIIK